MGSPDQMGARAFCGIDNVSAFYGPGIWKPWLLLGASVLINKIFIVERDNEAENSHILGIDLNLASLFAYPIIAAVDISAHIHHYFDDSVMSNRDIGRIEASLIVLREGIVLGALLLVACTLKNTRESYHHQADDILQRGLFVLAGDQQDIQVAILPVWSIVLG
jgi:hypothetical protein